MCKHGYSFPNVIYKGLIEKNNLGVNSNMPAMKYILGYYTLYRLLTFKSKLLTCFTVFDYNISYYRLKINN